MVIQCSKSKYALIYVEKKKDADATAKPIQAK
jgi:hypothetical protein